MALSLGATHGVRQQLVGVYGSYASEDTMYLICHVTFHVHFIEGSWEYTSRSS